MVGYEIELKGFDEQAARLKAEPAMVNQEFTVAMNQSVLTAVGQVRPLTPVFQSRLRGSIGGTVTSDGLGSVVGTVGSSLSGEVYPSVMEFGRTAGSMPPTTGALRRWVEIKLGDASLVFVVARAIAKKGIKGKEFMKRGGEAARGAVEGFFAAAVERIANRLAGK